MKRRSFLKGLLATPVLVAPLAKSVIAGAAETAAQVKRPYVKPKVVGNQLMKPEVVAKEMLQSLQDHLKSGDCFTIDGIHCYETRTDGKGNTVRIRKPKLFTVVDDVEA
jgi:hypothetical protein